MNKTYRIPMYRETQLRGGERVEGEPIEVKVRRLIKNKEPIKDGQGSLIYTERKDGVLAAYNIRTDRWEVAAEAMDKVTASKYAKTDAKVIPMNKDKDGEPEPTHGKTGDENTSQ